MSPVNLLESKSSSSGNSDQLPLDVVKLPSKGLLYSEDHPFHGCEDVEFKAMGPFEENILGTAAFIKKGTAINNLISSCILNKTLDPSSLLVGDKTALLLAIRISGYGPEYKVQTSCPECSKKFSHVFDLSQIQYKFISEEEVKSPGENLFVFQLPKTKKNVTFKLLTDGDDLDISQTQEARKKKTNQELDTTITDRLLCQIISIDSTTDKSVIERDLRTNKIPLVDIRALRKYINDVQPDLIFEEEVSCKFCGAKEVHTIPMGVEFLWPKLK